MTKKKRGLGTYGSIWLEAGRHEKACFSCFSIRLVVSACQCYSLCYSLHKLPYAVFAGGHTGDAEESSFWRNIVSVANVESLQAFFVLELCHRDRFCAKDIPPVRRRQVCRMDGSLKSCREKNFAHQPKEDSRSSVSMKCQ